jgi:hypothetical protein
MRNILKAAAMSTLMPSVPIVSLGGDFRVGSPSATGLPPQAPAPAGALTFDAASVKLNKSGSRQGFDTISPGGRLTFTNLSLQFLIRFAFERSPRSRGLEPFEVTGGSDWLSSDRFDVNATAGREA